METGETFNLSCHEVPVFISRQWEQRPEGAGQYLLWPSPSVSCPCSADPAGLLCPPPGELCHGAALLSLGRAWLCSLWWSVVCFGLLPLSFKARTKKHKSKQNKAQSCTKRYQSSFSKHSAAQNPRELSRIHANVSSDLNSILPAEGQGMCYLNPVKCWHLNTVIQGPPFSLLHIWASLHTCEFLLLLGHLILNFIPRVHIFATAQGDLISELGPCLLAYKAASTQVSDIIEKWALTLRSSAGSQSFRNALFAWFLLNQNILVSLNPFSNVSLWHSVPSKSCRAVHAVCAFTPPRGRASEFASAGTRGF